MTETSERASRAARQEAYFRDAWQNGAGTFIAKDEDRYLIADGVVALWIAWDHPLLDSRRLFPILPVGEEPVVNRMGATSGDRGLASIRAAVAEATEPLEVSRWLRDHDGTICRLLEGRDGLTVEVQERLLQLFAWRSYPTALYGSARTGPVAVWREGRIAGLLMPVCDEGQPSRRDPEDEPWR